MSADRTPMTSGERRAAASLAAIYGLRMLGMFLILPVFALHAQALPGGDNHTLIGLALGVYGLTQALLMIPFGMASDRWGRKPVIIVGLLIFALGSFIAAADSLAMIIVGRALQGAGAISAAVTALLADLTREEKRTQAMATIGSSIGLAFAFSLAAGPVLYRWIGLAGIFVMTGALSLLAILVLRYVTPNPGQSAFHSDAELSPARLPGVLSNVELMRLNWGIFALHAAQMAMFVVVPFALLRSGGLEVERHWQVYLPVLLLSFAFMVPAILHAERSGRMRPVFLAAIALMLVAQLGLGLAMIDLPPPPGGPVGPAFWGVVAVLLLHFIAFNILEASLPSLVSKLARPEAKGTAMGVYNTAQALGLFFGGAVGGWLAQQHGFAAVFAFCAVLITAWLALAWHMRPPARVKTHMFHIGQLDDESARQLAARLTAFTGIETATVLNEEGAVVLRVAQADWDEEGVRRLLRHWGSD